MIGIIPCGGKATRMNGIPKWLLPTPRGTLIDVLIERMHQTMPHRIVVMSKGLNTTLLHYTDHPGVEIVHRDDQSMSHAVMLAKEYAVYDGRALFGMPDTYFEDEQAFVRLNDALVHGADVAVGLFETRPEQRHSLGMCRIQQMRVVEVVDKPISTSLTRAWGVLAWKSSFWEHMRIDDAHVGHALPRAIKAGLDVGAVFLDGQYFDCGTPEEYFECIRSFEAVTSG